jgi:hypothetical protein
VSIRRAQDERIEGTPDGLTAVTEISDVPDAPIIGAVADLSTGSTASVAYTAATTGGTATTFTATSSPGGLTGTGASPITVSGLSTGVAYTFTVTASNSTGSSPASAASSSLTLASIGKYESIASVTVGGGGSSGISFTSIPATYTHLQIRGIWAHSTTNVAAVIGFNSATTSYTQHLVRGDGSVASSGSNTTGDGITGVGLTIASPSGSGGFGTSVIDIYDYLNTNKYKTVRALAGQDVNGDGNIRMYSGLWVNTNAISSIQITPNSSTFLQYTQFALYGIKGS